MKRLIFEVDDGVSMEDALNVMRDFTDCIDKTFIKRIIIEDCLE